MSAIDEGADEACGPVQAPAGNSGAAMIVSALSIGRNAVHWSRRDNGSSGRFRWIDYRVWDACGDALFHAEHGGPRMRCARAKVSMISIGAPQCRHTKVGCKALDPLRPLLGLAVSTICG